MRISDWSSDVCSSDLVREDSFIEKGLHHAPEELFPFFAVRLYPVSVAVPGDQLFEFVDQCDQESVGVPIDIHRNAMRVTVVRLTVIAEFGTAGTGDR